MKFVATYTEKNDMDGDFICTEEEAASKEDTGIKLGFAIAYTILKVGRMLYPSDSEMQEKYCKAIAELASENTQIYFTKRKIDQKYKEDIRKNAEDLIVDLKKVYDDFLVENSLDEENLAKQFQKTYLKPRVSKKNKEYKFEIVNIFGKVILCLGSVAIDETEKKIKREAMVASVITVYLCDNAFPKDSEKNFARYGKLEPFVFSDLLINMNVLPEENDTL